MSGGRSPDAPRRRVAAYAACYALSVTAVSLTVAASPVVGLALAPSAGLATLPVSLQILGTMAASLPASLLMGRIGRRAGFAVGAVAGMAGAGFAVLGIVQQQFWLFCAGSVGLGVLNGFAQLYRFAAADVAPASSKARAVSWVLAGGVLAGVAGPGLASFASEAVASAPFAGSYAAIVVLQLAVVAVLALMGPGRVVQANQQDEASGARPLRALAASPSFAFALLAGMTAYGSMSLVMTATPLTMTGLGYPFSDAARVIQFHVVAMFAPSFVTGHLIARYGTGRMTAAGFALLAATPAVALAGSSMAHFIAALVLLGIGWNLLFVAGTTVMASLHTANETAKVQGVNDLFVFGAAATGSLLAGRLAATLGWQGLHANLLPLLALAGGGLLTLAWLMQQQATKTALAADT